METIWQYVRYCLQILLKRPGFTLTVVITLALGVGANATTFTWIKAVLLEPLPRIERPDELVEIWSATRNNSALLLTTHILRAFISSRSGINPSCLSRILCQQRAPKLQVDSPTGRRADWRGGKARSENSPPLGC
jgi:hypothetical protein